MWTSGPAFVVALVVFGVLGLRVSGVTDGAHVAVDLAKLDQLFWITPLNLIPLVALLIFSLRKAPASLAVMGSALLAGYHGGDTATASRVAICQRSGACDTDRAHQRRLAGDRDWL